MDSSKHAASALPPSAAAASNAAPPTIASPAANIPAAAASTAAKAKAKASAVASCWLYDIGANRAQITSQGWQDGILSYIFANIGTTNKFFVEFGYDCSGDRSCGGGPNTLHLRTKRGWTGLLLDGGHENAAINLHRHYLSSANIVSLFEKYKVPSKADYVSIDIDSTDLWVFRAILASKKFRPRVFSVEYNANLALGDFRTFPDDPNLRCMDDTVNGASLSALNMVAVEFGYALVYVEPFLDAFFVRADLLTCAPPPIEAYAAVTHKVWNTRAPLIRLWKYLFQPRIEMVDYAAWRLRLSAENRGTALGRPLEESNW